jgi:hypothetical protein
MALAEAREKASIEFKKTLQATGRTIDEIRGFVENSPELRHPLCVIPRTPGVISTAANFVLYADQLMSGARRRTERLPACMQLVSNGRELDH